MICTACFKRPATQKHHKFHNYKWRRELYGKLMDDPVNLQDVCECCNGSHAGLGLIHWDEKQFCEAMRIEPRSKVGI